MYCPVSVARPYFTFNKATITLPTKISVVVVALVIAGPALASADGCWKQFLRVAPGEHFQMVGLLARRNGIGPTAFFFFFVEIVRAGDYSFLSPVTVDEKWIAAVAPDAKRRSTTVYYCTRALSLRVSVVACTHSFARTYPPFPPTAEW